MVNTSFRRAPWADVLYGCDWKWWKEFHAETVGTFTGERWTVNSRARDKFDLFWIYGARGQGLARNGRSINTGRNSGFQAIGLAALWGAARIILVGFDFKPRGQRKHWHADYGPKLGNPQRFDRWIAPMRRLSLDLSKAGIEVINCSRATALNCFERRSLEVCL